MPNEHKHSNQKGQDAWKTSMVSLSFSFTLQVSPTGPKQGYNSRFY